MIRFDEGNRRFNYRVVGVAVHDGWVLLHRGAGDPFWTLPGGRAELGETAAETLKREMREELDAEIKVVRALWFAENFFEYDARNYHEIALYLLMRFPQSGRFAPTTEAFMGRERDVSLTFRWFSREPAVLRALPVLPEFLQTGLKSLPETLCHIVQDGRRLTS